MNPYAANKALHHIDRLVCMKKRRQPNPVHLYIVVSDACNQNCNFCAYRMKDYVHAEVFGDNPTRLIPTTKAIEILGDAARMGVKAIQFTGGGEPTMHKDLSKIMLVAHALGLQTALVTNGVLLNEELNDVLIDSSWLRVSLDAGTNETYRRLRQVKSKDTFEKVQENVRRIVARRNEASASELYIGCSFIVTRDNWQEVIQAAELAASLGVDDLRIGPAYTAKHNEYFAEFGEKADALCREVEAMSSDGFHVSNQFTQRREDLALGPPEYERCPHMQLTTLIGANLNVYACCVNSYNEEGLIGSIKDKSLLQLWNSRQKWEYVDRFDARKCPRCQFNDKNREINALVGDLPDLHTNFV